MAVKLLVLQHARWEGPGRLLLAAASRHRLQLHVVQAWQQSIPEVTPYDGLLILGGSPNVDQEEQYPFLRDEKAVIRAAIAEDMPCLGFCLGHQLLAHVLGARIGNNSLPSVGFINGFLTHAGRNHPVFAGMPAEFSLFKWHGQAVREPLPDHLVVLATSGDCQVEAVSVVDRPHIIGVQFDNHAAHPVDVESWLQKDARWLASISERKRVEPAAVLAAARTRADVLQKEFALFLKNWLTLCRK